MNDQLQYKCPCCGGSIEFSSELQKMQCPYCDTEFEIETLQSYDDDLKVGEGDEMFWNTDGKEWSDGEDENLVSYICNSCGGEIVCDASTAATHCPFCDNPVIMQGNLSGTLRPDFVIPFKLNREAAVENLKKHLLNKKLLPKVFKDENHICEVKGIYVPFWLFDTDANARVRFRTTRVRSWSDPRYHYTETSHYSVIRGGHIGFSNVPADGSSKMADELMESIEPYDISDAVDFKTAYLSGYFADKYDVSADQSVQRVNERVKNSTEDAFASTVVGYASVIKEGSTVSLKNGHAKYALLPVWMLNTEWNSEKYTFAMNGQTGKFVGDLPCDTKAYWKWWGIFTAAASAVLSLISVFFFR